MAIWKNKEDAYREQADLKAKGIESHMTQDNNGEWEIEPVDNQEYGRYVESVRNPRPAPMVPVDKGSSNYPTLREVMDEADRSVDIEATPEDARAVLGLDDDMEDMGDEELNSLQHQAQIERARADVKRAQQERKDIGRGNGVSPGDVVNTINKFTRVRTNPEAMGLYVGTGSGSNKGYYDASGLKRMTTPGGSGQGTDGLQHLRNLTDPATFGGRKNGMGIGMDLSHLRNPVSQTIRPQRETQSPLARESLKANQVRGVSPIASIATQNRSVGVSPIASMSIKAMGVPKIGLQMPKMQAFSNPITARPLGGGRVKAKPIQPSQPKNATKKSPNFYKKKLKSIRKGK